MPEAGIRKLLGEAVPKPVFGTGGYDLGFAAPIDSGSVD